MYFCFDWKFRLLGLLEPSVRFECVAKTLFCTEIVLYKFRGRLLLFLKALGAVFLIFGALEAGLKIDRFLVVSRILSSMGADGKSRHFWSL